MVGIHKYGIGNWAEIAADSELGLTGKIFFSPSATANAAAASASNDSLSQQQAESSLATAAVATAATNDASPKPIQIARRVDYLMRILRQEAEEDRRHDARTHKRSSADAGSRTALPVKKKRKPDESASSPPTKPKKPATDKTASSVASSTGQQAVAVKLMKTVSAELEELKSQRSNADVQKVLRTIKRSIIPIGQRIAGILDQCSDDRQSRSQLETKLWRYVKQFWPYENVAYQQIKQTFEKVLAKQTAASNDEKQQRSPIAAVNSRNDNVNNQPQPLPLKSRYLMQAGKQ
jgi:hypothetical protein